MKALGYDVRTTPMGGFVVTVEGEVKVAVLGDSPGAEEYLQHINNFIRMLEKLG